jgi:Ca-activated chloride channel homolog
VSFAWPQALAALVLVPLAVWAYVAGERRRRAQSERFGNPALLPALATERPGRRRLLPPLILVAALALLLVAVARPHAMRSVAREEATVVLAIDTSRSMAATDLRPSRLEAARAAARAFLEKVPKRYRVAIVSFSTKPEVVLPPSVDRNAARASLSALRLGSGTAVGDALARALTLVAPQAARPNGRPARDQTPAAILLLTDGAQTVQGVQPLAVARRARTFNVPISAVALGTRAATVVVPLPGGLRQLVRVPPEPQSLKRIAQAAGGRFYEAPTAERLEEVYRELGTRLARERKRTEVTSLVAAAGGVLLLAGSALSLAWFGRVL